MLQVALHCLHLTLLPPTRSSSPAQACECSIYPLLAPHSHMPDCLLLFLSHPCPTLPPPSQAFQRLIYVSQVVFGDQKAAFLLPWRKHFPITEAQIFVARRDNAKTIFKALFEAAGGDLKADRWEGVEVGSGERWGTGGQGRLSGVGTGRAAGGDLSADR